MEAALLDLREVFAQPWEGKGHVEWRRGLRWLPMPTNFRFRTEIANEDTIELRFLGVRVARVTMRLERCAGEAT